ncbi:hypothetical protein LTS08_008738 [Lithohypha guttulata]|nr:hypothetical protein LTS08_008738 [Lithohypha guttulata]
MNYHEEIQESRSRRRQGWEIEMTRQERQEKMPSHQRGSTQQRSVEDRAAKQQQLEAKKSVRHSRVHEQKSTGGTVSQKCDGQELTREQEKKARAEFSKRRTVTPEVKARRASEKAARVERRAEREALGVRTKGDSVTLEAALTAEQRREDAARSAAQAAFRNAANSGAREASDGRQK